MSADDLDRRLDERLRQLTAEVVAAAPPPPELDVGLARGRSQRRPSAALVAAAAMVIIIAGLVAWRSRSLATTTSTVPAARPVSLEEASIQSSNADGSPQPAITFRVEGVGAIIAVRVERRSLCASDEVIEACVPVASIDAITALFLEGEVPLVVALVPPGTALAELTTPAGTVSQVPRHGIVVFPLPSGPVGSRLDAFGADGHRLGQLSR